MRLINIDSLIEKLEELKEVNKHRPLGVTMNMGLIQAMDVADSLPCYEVVEDDNGKID